MNLWVPLAPLLLGLPLAGLTLWLSSERSPVRLGRREALIWASVLWALAATLIALLLSLGAGHDPSAPTRGQLTRGWLTAVWLLLSLLAAAAIWRERGQLRRLAPEVKHAIGKLGRFERFLIWASALCLLLVALVAVISAPTTWDSMTYHLARVAAWLQLGGVRHYATAATPQLFQPPGAELLISQLQAISGGDRWAAGVQTSALLIAVVAVTLVARDLGAGRRGQLLAGFLAASAPLLLLEGSSTQNDLVVGLWLLIAGALGLRIAASEHDNFKRALLSAGAVALAILTKGTGWIFLPPVLLLIAWALIKRCGWRRTLAAAAAGLLIVLAFNAVPWLQNQQTFEQPIYSDSGAFDYSNDRIAPSVLVSNLIRNGALYLGTPSEQINARTTAQVRRLLERLGLDPDDATATFPGLQFSVPQAGPDESHGPSHLLFLLGLCALICVFASPALRRPELIAWALVVLGGALLFALLIKWQIWHTRLHLPLLLCSIPLSAVVLERLTMRERRRHVLTVAVVALAALTAPVYLLLNVDRPLIGHNGHRSILTTERAEQYFSMRPELAAPYRAVVAELQRRDVQELVMVGGFDDWYYPFSALLGQQVRTSYSLIANASARYPHLPGEALNDVVCLNCSAEVDQHLSALGLRAVPGLRFQIQPTPERHGAIVELWRRPGS